MFLRGFPWLCCHAQMLPCFDTKGRQLGLGFKGFDPENWVMAGSRMQMVFLSATIFLGLFLGWGFETPYHGIFFYKSGLETLLQHASTMLHFLRILFMYIYIHIFFFLFCT